MVFKNLTVAVTGGTGFVGSALVTRLLELDCSVKVLTRNTSWSCEGVTVFYGDLADDESTQVIEDFCDQVDVMFHCAGEVINETNMEAVHVGGTTRLINSCGSNLKRWIQLSSVGAYGRIREGKITADTKCGPEGLYEVTKTKSDKLIEDAFNDYVIVRPSIVFGKNMKNKSLRQLVLMLKRRLFFFINPDALLNYVHVDDLVSVLCKVGLADKNLQPIVIVSRSLPVRKVIQAFCRGLEISEPRVVVPERIARMLAACFSLYSGFPLTNQRIDALTSRSWYSDCDFKQILGASKPVSLDQQLETYAKEIN